MPDSNGSNDGDESEPQYPWVNQQPNSRIIGTPVAMFYAGEMGPDVKQNADSYALLIEDPEVVLGSLYVNQGKPDDGNTRDVVAEESTSPTDYRVVSEDSGVGAYVNELFTTSEESEDDNGNGLNVYEPVDSFDEDRIIVYYNGMSGSRVGRTLDFNGQQYARWTETPYLVKGLYQAHPEWRGAGSQKRAELASEGNAPRVARPPVPRFKVDGQDYLGEDDYVGDEILIDVTIYNEDDPTSGYEVHIFDADDFEDEFGDLSTPVSEMDRGQYGLDVDSELEYVNHDDPETILEQAQTPYMMYEGDWTEEPADWSLEYDTGTHFGIQAELEDDEGETADDGSSMEEELADFAEEVATYLPEGQSPEDAFDGGLAGLADRKSGLFSDEPTDEDVETAREQIYESVSWLDTSDL